MRRRAVWLLTQEEATYWGREKGECGQAETDGGSPAVTGDGPAAQQLPFEYLS